MLSVNLPFVLFYRFGVFEWRLKLPKHWVSSWDVSSAVGFPFSPCTSSRLSAMTAFPKWHFPSSFGSATATRPSTPSFTPPSPGTLGALLRKSFASCCAADPLKTRHAGFSWPCIRETWGWAPPLSPYTRILYRHRRPEATEEPELLFQQKFAEL